MGWVGRAEGVPVDEGHDSSAASGASSTASGLIADAVRSLQSRPGGALARVIEVASASPWPVAWVPVGPSTDPLADVVRPVAAARRLESWSIWAQLNMIARLVAAWEAAPPVSNDIHIDDRCEPADPALTTRLNSEIWRFQRRVRGECFGDADALAGVFAMAEVSLACGLTRWSADRRVEVAQALFLEGRLPRVHRLLRAGWVDWAKLDAFVHETEHLDPIVANAVERIVVGDLPGEQRECPDSVDVLADPERPGEELPAFVRLTTPQLRMAIANAITRVEAEAADRRTRAAREGRGVSCQVSADGMAKLTADLAVEAAAAVWNALTAAAKAAKAAGDPRTFDQLRADELLARTTGASPLSTVDTDDRTDSATDSTDSTTNRTTDSATGSASDRAAASALTPMATTTGSDHAETTSVNPPQGDRDSRGAPSTRSPACVPLPRVPLAVSLTMPLSTYLGLVDDPGQLDGYGPIPAGLARRLAADAARATPTTTWRCVIVDDEHGTVLGVGRPISTPLHNPPPRLVNLIRSMEPTCCFPGCRIAATRCDLDHRIPYDEADPDRGGRTCSCNLQPLCRTHHRLKTTGLIRVREVDPCEDPSAPPGTLRVDHPRRAEVPACALTRDAEIGPC